MIDGRLQVVVFGPKPGTGIPKGRTALLYIPVIVRPDAQGTPSFSLESIVLSNVQALQVPVVPGETSVVVPRKDLSLPATFTLSDAVPNPFNSSSKIACEVPTPSS
jgi:hypothetical protein